MELIAKLLLEIEKMPPGEEGLNYPEEYDRTLVIDHLFIMWDAGLIEAYDCSSSDERNLSVHRMKWLGHEFLDSVRKGDVWDQLGTKLKEAPFEVVLDVAKSYAKKKLGLG